MIKKLASNAFHLSARGRLPSRWLVIWLLLGSDTPTVTGRATQAIYTRDPSNRPAFYEFTW